MKTIVSRDNRIFKELIKLNRKKYRDEKNQYMLEGPKSVFDAMNMGVKVDSIFLCQGYDFNKELPEGTIWAEDKVWTLSPKLFKEASGTENSQGIIAVADKNRYTLNELNKLIRADDNILVIDRVQDPGNMGTMIRTAEAAGYKGIVVMKGSADVYSPKVVRAAAGSLFRMPVYFADDDEQLIAALKTSGKIIAVASLDTDKSCFDVDMTKNIALVIGNEGQGVSQRLQDAAEMKILIPMEGSIESLNAAVAAGILMYQSLKTK